MSSRDAILSRIRANRPAVEAPLPDVPFFDAAPPAALLDWFADSLQRMGGTMIAPSASGDPREAVADRLALAGVICSAVPEIAGNRALADVSSAAALEDVDIAIVRAGFAIAETGSIFLSEAELRVNVLGYLAQHLIVLLDPADLVGNLHHAYRRPEFHARRYAVLQTGPSATADIEGVLIRGAQGVRSLAVLPHPRATTGGSA